MDRLRPLATTIALALAGSALAAPPTSRRPPVQPEAGIQHVVVVMMENRSFDHLLGWHPTADGEQAGLSYPDDDGVFHETWPLAPDYMGCGYSQPDHSWEGGREQYDGGAMDGFLRSGDNDEYAIGYYEEADSPFLSALARNYTTLDRSFASIMGPTYPNRLFLYAAQTDRIENTLDPTSMPTIFDRLAAKGLSARYYFSDLSFLAFWGPKYVPISRTYSQFLEDAASGNLPKVSFVDAEFLAEELGTCSSEHPFCDIRKGDAWLARTFEAVATGPQWRSTVFIVTFDEWGGFFDHVAPPRAAAPNGADPDVVGGKALLGMRVPTIVASPFSKGNPSAPRVSHEVFDHTSILKLIEKRWGLAPLTARDASSDVGDMTSVLDFTRLDATLPRLPFPDEPDVEPCSIFEAQSADETTIGLPMLPIRN